MSQVDKQALREAAVAAKTTGEAPVMPFDQWLDKLIDFSKRLPPETVIALLDENEALEKRVVELTSENADLKHPGTYLPSKIDTPATDAFINEMRAKGVESCAAWLQGGCKYSRMAEMLREFAQNLREPKA
ncbi:ead/Ea22-like family protein [Edwardsiella tarda]|uniref:Uncharacterized protein n=1 Tax=Edwardsiella tarda TaxID=636 RepID=A0A2A7U0W5_EDWTA|nr:ead/Ea22-like family protein [Edwardsiella tarda]PEH72052.1 hypothetical protein CRM76_09045 [Edwardsiella tarda]